MTRSDQPAVDDIVERLRRWPCDDIDNIYDIKDKAADEIERLRIALNVAADEISRAELFWNMTPNELADWYIHLAQEIIKLDGPTRKGNPQ